MAKTILNSLFGKPATLMYPVVKRDFTSNARGKVEINVELCVFCGICQKKCPTGAITVDRQAKKWEIERFKCITCNYCVEACPKKCLTMGKEYTKPGSTKNKEVFENARVFDNATNS
jgi:formate hydrogenlyase subunit 6/NADH:ubiquinone oxidoreductase subunit I